VSYDKTIRLWESHTGQQVGEPWTGHIDWLMSVAFSSEMLAIGNNYGKIFLWNPQTGQQVRDALMGHTGWVSSVAFGPECVSLPEGGVQVLASGSLDKTIQLWDPHTGQKIGEPLMGHMDSVLSVAFSLECDSLPKGSGLLLASGSNDWNIHMWDVSTNIT
jgi:WD40 repeat protein